MSSLRPTLKTNFRSLSFHGLMVFEDNPLDVLFCPAPFLPSPLSYFPLPSFQLQLLSGGRVKISFRGLEVIWVD